eukprot:GHVT01087071.1.p1 GENE.GHVT01087071.1~~GHVT01087071.1.p1  ORF type:complete len:130 (+),score=29.72 GHVT01087071.1:264-653(+)
MCCDQEVVVSSLKTQLRQVFSSTALPSLVEELVLLRSQASAPSDVLALLHALQFCLTPSGVECLRRPQPPGPLTGPWLDYQQELLEMLTTALDLAHPNPGSHPRAEEQQPTVGDVLDVEFLTLLNLMLR